MKNHIVATFERMDLRQIREFLLIGTNALCVDDEPYDTRLIQGSSPIYERLRGVYSEQAEFDTVAAELALAITAHEAVYMEIGMKAGARLVHQLLLADDTLPQGCKCTGETKAVASRTNRGRRNGINIQLAR